MNLYHLFADLIDYPRPLLHEQVDQCATLLSSVNRDAAIHLKPFQDLLETIPISQMEEVYTRTFDHQANCCPYVGYHLFGGGRRRGIFMARLKELHRTFGFLCGHELPDHLSVMLRFLAGRTNNDREELIALCLIPALSAMIDGLDGTSNPYRGVLQALLLVLRDTQNCRFRTASDLQIE